MNLFIKASSRSTCYSFVQKSNANQPTSRTVKHFPFIKKFSNFYQAVVESETSGEISDPLISLSANFPGTKI